MKKKPVSAKKHEVPDKQTLPLFRSSALKHRHKPTNSNTFQALPVSFGLLLSAILTVTVCMVLFISTTEYARKERVQGFVNPSTGMIKIYPAKPGVVSSQHVVPGQKVSKNQLLLTIDEIHFLGKGGDLPKKIENLYTNRLEILNNSLALFSRRQNQRSSAGEKEIISQRNRIENIDGSIELQKSSLAQLEQQKTRLHNYYTDGHITRLDWTNLLLKISAEHQKLNHLQQQKINLHQQLESMQEAVDSQKMEIESNELKLESEISKLLADRFAFLGSSTQQLRAPVASTVSAILASPGTHANSSRPVIYLLPTDASLEVTLMIPSRAIAFIKKGQTADLLFDALPHQHFGTLEATIEYVTPNTVKVSETDFPLSPLEPVYLVKTRLVSQFFKTINQSIPLQPGMLLKADIKLENRTLLEWLLEPIKGIY